MRCNPILVTLVLALAAWPTHATSSMKSAPAHRAPARLQFPGDAVPPKAQTHEAAARELLERHARDLGVSVDVLRGLTLDAIHDTGRGGVLVSFRHREGGIEVWHDAVKVLMDRHTHALVALSGQMHGAAPADPVFALDARAAVISALRGVTYRRVAGEVHVDDAVDGAGYHAATLARGGDLIVRSARVKPVLAPVGDIVVPAYVVELFADAIQGGHWSTSAVVEAAHGDVLKAVNLRHDAAFSYRVWADEGGDHRPFDSPLGDTTPYPAAAPDGHFPPVVSPNLVTIDGFNKHGDPWLADGATETNGNNVDAYTDDGNPDGFSTGDLRGAVTSPGVFDHAIDFAQGPQESDEARQASATSLFYLTNWLHDFWYDSGFDEQAHNAQASNLGRGGVEGDALQALAQYAAPDARDNSVMDAADDGASPHMFMFVWSGPGSASLGVGGAPTDFNVADFGPQTFSLSADAALLDDGAAPNADGCSPAVNDLTGKIALVDRGTCEFVEKVNAAQAAGAVGVIILDNDGTETAPPVFGDPNINPQPTLPVMSVSLADADAMKVQLQAGPLTVAMQRQQDPDIDGGLDTTVAAHEWGHYLHLRQVICDSAQCAAQSEGWGDYNALQIIVREGDDLNGAFAVGSFAVKAFPDDAAYFGIRRYPYSADLAKNPLTFQHIADSATLPTTAPIAQFNAGAPNSESHAAGEIWAEMMFEAFLSLMDRAHGATPAYSFEDARRRMADAVEIGLKLAPENPTYTEMRDAVLAGAETADAADAQAMAAAFAKRGAGTCAVSPPRDSNDFEGVVEDFNVSGSYVVADVALDDSVTSCDSDGLLDAGETGRITVTVRNASATALDGAVVAVTSDSVGLHIAQPSLQVGHVAPFGSTTVVTQVSLDASAPALTNANISAAVSSGPTCSGGGVTITPLTNADNVDTGLSTDSVEGTETTWAPAGDFSEFIWGIFESDPSEAGGSLLAGNHLWNGFDADGPTDTSLVSPPLAVGNDALVVHFKHRHDFEADQSSNYDGGVVEISDDGGTTWNDIAATADPGYEGIIGDTANQAHNTLKDRSGFVGKNPSYPAFDDVSVDLGTAFAGKTIQLRFRVATDEGTGAEGWLLDDIGFDGITNGPFSGLTPNAKTCTAAEGEGEGEGEGATPAPAGCGCASAQPGEALLGVVGLILLRRRRRR